MSLVIAGTGHRPNKLFGGYDNYPSTIKLLEDIAISMLNFYQPTLVKSGMALGFDTALALAALSLKIPLECHVPFLNYETRWSDELRKPYYHILKQPEAKLFYTTETIPEEGKAKGWLFARNRKLTQGTDLMIALFNGVEDGGTYNCLQSVKNKMPIVNIWSMYDSAYHLGFQK